MKSGVHWSEKDLENHKKRGISQRMKKVSEETKRSKYNNKKVVHGSLTFDSQKEFRRWLVLKDMEAKGEISDLQRQITYLITHGEVKICKYIADFEYVKDGGRIIEDVKGYRKGAGYAVFRLKAKLIRAFYAIDIIEI